jgi:hypothetical protein
MPTNANIDEFCPRLVSFESEGLYRNLSDFDKFLLINGPGAVEWFS